MGSSSLSHLAPPSLPVSSLHRFVLFPCLSICLLLWTYRGLPWFVVPPPRQRLCKLWHMATHRAAATYHIFQALAQVFSHVFFMWRPQCVSFFLQHFLNILAVWGSSWRAWDSHFHTCLRSLRRWQWLIDSRWACRYLLQSGIQRGIRLLAGKNT